jgi:serine/threonine-protein kinase RsbW
MAIPNQPKELVVRLRFCSDVGRIPLAVEQIMSVVRRSGCVLGQEIEVELALGEALSNAVMHGNRMDPDKWVHVRCTCDLETGVSIIVRDQGQGFDPSRVPDATTPRGIRSVHGRGILIMQSYMDAVSFEKGGTEVRMCKDPALARVGSSRSSTHILSSGSQPLAASGSGDFLQRSMA